MTDLLWWGFALALFVWWGRHYVVAGGSGMRAGRCARTYPNLVVQTSAPIHLVRSSVLRVMSGAAQVREDGAQRIVLQPHDESFVTTVVLQTTGPQAVRAIVSIDDRGCGGASDASARDMRDVRIEDFLGTLIGAFQKVDPMVHLSR